MDIYKLVRLFLKTFVFWLSLIVKGVQIGFPGEKYGNPQSKISFKMCKSLGTVTLHKGAYLRKYSDKHSRKRIHTYLNLCSYCGNKLKHIAV